MNKNARMFVSGQRGVRSVIVRRLQALGYANVLTRSRAELCRQLARQGRPALLPSHWVGDTARRSEQVEGEARLGGHDDIGLTRDEQADYYAARRDSLVKLAGFKAGVYYE
jgi:hypothetical protein